MKHKFPAPYSKQIPKVVIIIKLESQNHDIKNESLNRKDLSQEYESLIAYHSQGMINGEGF
jgi:hypothetical protein